MKRTKSLLYVILAFAVSMSIQESRADLPVWSDTYQSPSYYAGFGLGGHYINGDNKIDLVTTSWYFSFPEGGYTWFIDNNNVYHTSQTISGGLEAKFGNMMNRRPWYLAVSGVDLVLYEVESNALNPIQTFSDVSEDYIAWGHVNGDNFKDLVSSGGINENHVQIYTANSQNEQLNNPTIFNTLTDVPGKLALVRTQGFWEDDHRWDLVTVEAGTKLKIYPNNGSGGFTTSGELTIHPGGMPGTYTITDFALGDIDNDGFDDIVLCAHRITTGVEKVFTYLADGNGSFNTTANQVQTFEDGVEQVTLGKYDYNGYPDLAVLTSTGNEALIFVNSSNGTGNFVFTDEVWEGSITDVSGYFWGYEMMFADLAGNGAYSLVLTGVMDDDPVNQKGLYVWYNPITNDVPPVSHSTFDLMPSNHPMIKWALNEEIDIADYLIYRALMEDDTTKPAAEDFDLLAAVDNTTTSYTDSTVTIHTQNDNYYIWYAVTARDDDDNESPIFETVKAWGYYQDGDVSEMIFFNQPDGFALSAAPNPFNPATTLRYEMPYAAHVTLQIFDISGREVATLMDAQREAGTHNLTWDAGHLPSGVYFALIQVGDYSATQKLMLMK